MALVVGCSNDVEVGGKITLPPQVTITSPVDGDTYTDADGIDLIGQVADGNGLGDIASIEWSSDVIGVLATQDDAPLDSAGLTRFATSLPVGTHVISLTAVDFDDDSAQASVSVVVETAAFMPTAEISLPAPFQRYLPGEVIQLIGGGSDPNQAPNTLIAAWSWEPEAGGARSPIDSGAPSPVGTTSAQWAGAPIGVHRVVLEIFDDDGNVAEADVIVEVEDPNAGDADLDGFTPGGGDCDDGDPNVHPGADEACNLIDDDCNGVVDDKDLDGDNHVDEACLGYTGAIPVDDCDDADGTTFPGAAEQADYADNDCNGLVDDGLSNFDNDGDCYCTALGCVGSINPACTTVDPGDCDDDDATLNLDDLDGDGFSTCDGDCDDGDPLLEPGDFDADGASTCDGDCDDANGLLTPFDYDSDGASTCAGDCDDGAVSLNLQDNDGDGWSTCAGDCDDASATLNLDDADADGTTSCGGDCDDGDATLNVDDVDGDTYTTCDGDCFDSDPALIPVDGDGDGVDVCEGDCDDGNPLLNPYDDDADGASSCDGDCNDGDASLNLRDLDADGYTTCAGDCNDSLASLSPADADADGASSCAGDCDDASATLNIADADGDGQSTCAGDCDDSSGALDDLDRDTDGVSSCDGDCIDTDLTVYPGQTEIPYNNKDDDCVGGDLTDVDGDGYDATIVGGSDCNDNNASVRPGATESCNNADDDCDTSVDEENASGCSTYYYDYDSDGYGTFSQKCLCDPGDVAYYTATNNQDCYDLSSDARPGQTTYFYDHRGDGSWDYNCDYTQSKSDTRTNVYDCDLCGFLDFDCCYSDGWLGSVPSCGQSRDWGSGCYWIPAISCEENSASTIDIRCR